MNAAPRPFLPNVCQECQNEAPPRVYKVKVFAASLRPVTDLRGAVRDREEEGDTQPHSFQNDDAVKETAMMETAASEGTRDRDNEAAK